MKLEYLLIKTENDFCSTEEQFKNFLQTNMRIHIGNDQITFSGIHLTYTLGVEHIAWGKSKDIVFRFEVSVSSTEDVTKLEEFDVLIRRINSELGGLFKINTIWDDVSLYYTRLLYPEIAEVESLMRKLIYRFMVRVAGGSWYEDTVPPKVKDDIKSNAVRNKVEDLSEDYLRYANFDQLGLFLFEKYSIMPFDNIPVEKLKDNLNEPKLKDEVESFIKNYARKSNWDRYFWDKISIENLDKKWENLYKYRNTVAHSKKIKGEEYRNAQKLISEIKTAFISSIDQIDNVLMSVEEADAVREMAKTTIDPVKNNTRNKLQVIADVLEKATRAYNTFASQNDAITRIFEKIASLNSISGINTPEMISEMTAQQSLLAALDRYNNLPETEIAEKVRKEMDYILNAAKTELDVNESLKKVAELDSRDVDT